MSKKIGFLVAATPNAWQPYKKAFEDELKTKGWTIGNGTGAKDVSIDYQPRDGAAGKSDTFASVAKQFVTNKVDVIVTAGTAAAQACQSATSSIPIVFASAGDPVRCGLVASLTKPGGNVTGCANMQTDQTAIDNRISVMRTKMHPTKVGVIGNDNPQVCPIDSALNLAWSRVQNAGIPAVLRPLRPTDFQSRQTIKEALTPLQQQGVDVLLICSDPLLSANAHSLIQAAHDLGMRTMHEFREHVDQHGGNRSHGPSFTGLFGKAADMVDEILGGKSPGDIPVYQPTTFEEAP
ncbi:MAG: ABC transporter substrate-binding protein [Bradyrhizobiaceae bacterium]|nr:ABC transporter substrate-binding protein [Bradyrhizobiaceae bacterium]